VPFPSYAYHPSMKPLSPFFFELTNSFLFVGGSWSVGYPEIMKQWKVSSFLLSPNLLGCVCHYMHACMHACLFEIERWREREMHIREPGGGWFLWVSGFCILKNEKVSCVKVAGLHFVSIKLCVCAELYCHISLLAVGIYTSSWIDPTHI